MPLPETEDQVTRDIRDIRNLSYAEHFIIWVMRTAIACASECRMIHREFTHAFGPHVEAGAKAFERVLLALAKSPRPITLARPGHIYITHDEQSLLALFEAAQSGDEARCLAHARWMMGGKRADVLCEAVVDLSLVLGRNGRTFRRMPQTVPPEGCAGEPARLHAVS